MKENNNKYKVTELQRNIKKIINFQSHFHYSGILFEIKLLSGIDFHILGYF